jgi:hypothetical protein
MNHKHPKSTQSPVTEARARERHNRAPIASAVARGILARLEAAERTALCDWMQMRSPIVAAILRGEGRA